MEYTEWKQLREGKITGTKIAAICGMDNYCSPLALWAEMTGRTKQEETPASFAMRAGQVLEPLVADVYRQEHGLQERDVVGYGYDLVQHPTLDWAAATPDYCIQASKLLEIKTGKKETMKNWIEGIPTRYLFQGQWEMECTGFSEVDFAVIFGADASTYHETTLQKNPELIKQMIIYGEMFLQHLTSDTPPTWGINANDTALITSIYKANETERVPTSAEETSALIGKFTRYVLAKGKEAELNAELKALKEQTKQIEAEALAWLAGATTGRVDNFFINQKTVTRKGYEVKPSSYTTLTIKEK